jgi:hypothetical protein
MCWSALNCICVDALFSFFRSPRTSSTVLVTAPHVIRRDLQSGEIMYGIAHYRIAKKARYYGIYQWKLGETIEIYFDLAFNCKVETSPWRCANKRRRMGSQRFRFYRFTFYYLTFSGVAKKYFGKLIDDTGMWIWYLFIICYQVYRTMRLIL